MLLVWLAAPYVSLYALWRWRPAHAFIACNPIFTLVVGWLAVSALLLALLRVWRPGEPVLALCAGLSGLAMLTARAGRDDDGPDEDEPEDEPPPEVDWDAFDDARSGWDRPLVGPPAG
jgi:hypothetical protein